MSQNLQEFTKQNKKNKQAQSRGKANGGQQSMVKPNVPKFAQYVHKRDSTKSLDEQQSSFEPPALTKQEKKKAARPQGLKQHLNSGSFISMNISPFNTTQQNANQQEGIDDGFDGDISIMQQQANERLDDHSQSQMTPNVPKANKMAKDG